jgi:hypothetical protein
MASKQGMSCSKHVEAEGTVAVAQIRTLCERQELLLKSRMIRQENVVYPVEIVSSTIDGVSEVGE